MNVIDASERFNRVGNNNAATGRNTTEAQNNDTLNTNQKENEQPTVNESEFTTRVNKKNQILSEALKALNSGDTSILPEEERQKLETKAPGYARVIQGRIDNIQNSITEENRTESEEKIKSLQNILNTTNGINNYFENKKQNENQEDVSIENESFPTNETQENLNRFEDYLKPDAYSRIPGNTITEKIENVKKIIEWMQDNIDSLPNEIKEKAEFALNKFKKKLNLDLASKLEYEFKPELSKLENILNSINVNIKNYFENLNNINSSNENIGSDIITNYFENQEKNILSIDQLLKGLKEIKEKTLILDTEYKTIPEEERVYITFRRISPEALNDVINSNYIIFKNNIKNQDLISSRLFDDRDINKYRSLKNKIEMVGENFEDLIK